MSNTKPTLLVLAAGMASRYGGIKQLESVGQNGETLLDYSVHDAIKAGCGKVVFVIRGAIEKDFMEKVFNKIAKVCDAEYAFQETTSLIPQNLLTFAKERQKPYGTVQAILSAADKIKGNFIVINADDFYGAGSYQTLCKHFTSSNENALVGYTLGKTLSDIGTVNRGVCRFDASGKLVKIEETYKIAKNDSGKIMGADKQGSPVELSENDIASMNFFGFNHSILADLEKYWADFTSTISADNSAECLLPVFCNEKLKEGTLTFKCYTATDQWFGMTYKEDREQVRALIAKYSGEGLYPSPLYG